MFIYCNKKTRVVGYIRNGDCDIDLVRNLRRDAILNRLLPSLVNTNKLTANLPG